MQITDVGKALLLQQLMNTVTVAHLNRSSPLQNRLFPDRTTLLRLSLEEESHRVISVTCSQHARHKMSF